MSPIIFITSANKHLYDTWFSKAVTDETVWPYLSFQKRTSALTVENDDWNHSIFMDESCNAVLEWIPSRSNGMHDASVSLWSLTGAHQRQAAGQLASALPAIAKRYGVAFVGAACHASNENSVRILTKRFGEPWGRCPANAWNGKIGSFEDSLHFRARLGP
jgi:hypothetical protein